MGRLEAMKHDFSLPYDLVEAYRGSGTAQGAAFISREGESYIVNSSYGVPRTMQTLALEPPLVSLSIGSAHTDVLLPVSVPHAYLALFGDHDDARPVRELIAAKGASWAFFRSERMGARPPELLSAEGFPEAIIAESHSRGLPGLAAVNLDLSPLLAYVAENRPSAHTDRVQADLFLLLSCATRETGLVLKAPGGRALIVHFSRHPADPELIGEQLHKMLRRAIGAPPVLESVCENVLSLSALEPGATGVLEAFATGL